MRHLFHNSILPLSIMLLNPEGIFRNSAQQSICNIYNDAANHPKNREAKQRGE